MSLFGRDNEIPPLPRSTERARRLGWLLVGALACWQLAAVFLVDVESYDGLETLLNARFLLGDAPDWSPARWPFLPLLVLPAEWLREPLQLHPLDVRFAHAISGALHVLYVVGTWTLLARTCGANWPTLAAFAAAIPSYLFFSSAPFLSNDLAPGLALLWMILAAHAYLAHPRARTLGLLVALGAAAALIKPSYGILWLSVLLATGANVSLDASLEPGRNLRRWGSLIAGASASAVVYWIVCAAVLPGSGAWWLEPYHQLRDLAAGLGARQPPAWVYVRNLPAYGYAAALLIVPALGMSLRAGGVQRTAAIAWLVCALALQLHVQREVRYLAFLAPTTALLLIEPLRAMLHGTRARAGAVATIALLVAPWLPSVPYSPLAAALRIGEPMQRNSELRSLLEPLGWGDERRRPLAFLSYGLSFAPSDRASVLAGDPFHEIQHFGPAHLALLGYEKEDVVLGAPGALSQLVRSGFAGWVLFSSQGALSNPYAWEGGPPVGRAALDQGLGRTADVTLPPDGGGSGGYLSPDGTVVHTRTAVRAGRTYAGLEGTPGATLERLRGTLLVLPGQADVAERLFELVPVAGVGYVVPELAAWPALPPDAPLRLRGVLLEREQGAGR